MRPRADTKSETPHPASALTATGNPRSHRLVIVSIETPVFKGVRLQRCIDSVLAQNSPNYVFSLLWDGGDEQSWRILEDLGAQKLPKVTVHFGENRGIAKARRFLTEHSRGDFILPLDDDDALPFNA